MLLFSRYLMLRVLTCSKHPPSGCRDVRTKLSHPKFMLRHTLIITIFLSPLQYSNFTRNISTTRRDETQAPTNIQTIPACTYTWTIDKRQTYQNTHVPFFYHWITWFCSYKFHDSRRTHVFIVHLYNLTQFRSLFIHLFGKSQKIQK